MWSMIFDGTCVYLRHDVEQTIKTTGAMVCVVRGSSALTKTQIIKKYL